MKPRIFISSTFYDLKYIREDISNFVRAHDFEPIMFEDGDIGYTPGRTLDESCYETMKSADMVILIIGGNYGSPASGEKADKFKEYLSVTRKEFSTAVNEGIPVYAFVESAVYAEYGVYDLNFNKIEEQQINLGFKATKDINVFRFIKEIYSLGKVTVTEFRKPSEIKDFLSKQWSDMFKNYLKLLKEKNDSKQIHDAMDNLQSLIKRMDIMVDGLGKKVIGNEDITYDIVLKQQVKERAREFAVKIIKGFEIDIVSKIGQDKAVKEAYTTIKDILGNIQEWNERIGVPDTARIIDIANENFEQMRNIKFTKGDLDFFLNWRSNIEIFSDKALDMEVLKMLQSDFFSKQFIAIRKEENK